MRAKLAGLLIKSAHALVARLKTQEAFGVAIMNGSSRLGHDGRVVNISGRQERINIGAHSMIRGEILVFAHAGRIAIGDWLYLGPGSTIWSSSEAGIRIGNRVLISMNVSIHDTNSHPLDHRARFEQTKAVLTSGHPVMDPGIRAAPVVIGDDVWIGQGASIKKGVTIGDRAIIGANAIVTSDVPTDSLVPSPSMPEIRGRGQ